MRAMRHKILIGEMVELKDSYRVYDHDGLFYITRDKEKAFEIAHALLTGQEVRLA